jgi:3-hydroxyacyl-CoA dehydrogenase
MNIGIIGAGGIGQAFALQAAKAGYDVIGARLQQFPGGPLPTLNLIKLG